jgi:hypothetical protein
MHILPLRDGVTQQGFDLQVAAFMCVRQGEHSDDKVRSYWLEHVAFTGS